ncbi:hypothetical protein [Rhizobium sp. Rhizsp82]|uniref:hypothetical protein n=1 Tax=Rhizobium sp. Rhizsp82 TaxID=3243057 RepID=UPI0039B6630C
MKSPKKTPQSARLRVPAGIYRHDVTLTVDGVMVGLLKRGSKLHAAHRKLSKEEVIAHGRRALEAAIHRAIDAEQTLELGAYKQDWIDAQHAAERARNSLLAFIKTLVPGSTDRYTSRLKEALVPAMMDFRLNHPAARDLPPRGIEDDYEETSYDDELASIYEKHHPEDSERPEEVPQQTSKPERKGAEAFSRRLELARADSTFIYSAYEVLAGFVDHAEETSKRIGLNRPNPGAPAKKAFVALLADVWSYLTGGRPGTQPERSPFLDFVRAAWVDAGGDENEEFAYTIRRLIDEMPDRSGEDLTNSKRPYWL